MTIRVRTLFLSDIHLGTRTCQTDHLPAFLKEYECDNPFLIGDITDFRAMNLSAYWPASRNTVVQKVLKKVRHGTKVLLIPGNHDELLPVHVDSNLVTYTWCVNMCTPPPTAKNSCCCTVTNTIRSPRRWVSSLGDISYTFLIHLNRGLSWLRRRMMRKAKWCDCTMQMPDKYIIKLITYK